MLESLHIRQIPETVKTDTHPLIHHRHDDFEMADLDQTLRMDMILPEDALCRSAHTLIRQWHDKRLPVKIGKIEMRKSIALHRISILNRRMRLRKRQQHRFLHNFLIHRIRKLLQEV